MEGEWGDVEERGGGGMEGMMEGFRGDSGPLCPGTAVLGGPDVVGVPDVGGA